MESARHDDVAGAGEPPPVRSRNSSVAALLLREGRGGWATVGVFICICGSIWIGVALRTPGRDSWDTADWGVDPLSFLGK